MAGRRKVPRAGRRDGALQVRNWETRRRSARRLASKIRAVQEAVSAARRPPRQDAAPLASRRMGQRHSLLPCRSQRPRRARFLGKSVERDCQECALAHWWISRFGAVHEDAAHIRWRRRFQRRELWRTQPALRHSRARDALHPQRIVALEAASVWLAVPYLQRLRPHVDPAECHYGTA